MKKIGVFFWDMLGFFSLEKMPSGYQIFENFEKEEFVHIEDLTHMVDYICHHLNCDYSPNYKYWYNQYWYSLKAYIVCRWRKSKGLQPVAKWGEAICEDELVNFFKDEKHKNCSCGSVYYFFFFLNRKKKDTYF